MKQRRPHSQPPHDRTEPRLGDVGELQFREANAPSEDPPKRRWTSGAADWFSKSAVTWILGAGLLLLAAGTLFRQPLADWLWQEKRALEMRDAAASALARGHLTASDGSGARELYEAAVAIDPDRRDTRAGLVAVGYAALQQAGRALAKDDFDAARQGLALARELAVPRDETEAFATRLRDREAGMAGIDHLLAQAVAAHEAGRFDGADDAALPLYRRILVLQPDRVEALEGREDTLSDFLQEARRKLEGGDVVAAAAMIDAAADYDSGHVDLPEIRGQLNSAMDRLRSRAGRDLRRGALPRAAAGYAAVLAVQPEDTAALRGQENVAAAYAQRARQAAADFRFDKADADLREARRLSSGGTMVADTEQAIRQAKQARERFTKLSGNASGQGRSKQVALLLRQAREAEERGDLLSPPGESAFDRLRSARALAPDDPDVRNAQRRLAPAARRCFERELPRNDLRRAGGCLDAWTALDGGGEAYETARRRLARRWLAVADERLGAGELKAAAIAVGHAEELEPGADGLADFRQRLEAATASGN